MLGLLHHHSKEFSSIISSNMFESLLALSKFFEVKACDCLAQNDIIRGI
jgi:hypothetical protein